MGNKVSIRRVKRLKTRSRRRRRTFISIAKRTETGMRQDKRTIRVMSGACRIRRLMRVGTERICRSWGRATGISSLFKIPESRRGLCISWSRCRRGI